MGFVKMVLFRGKPERIFSLGLLLLVTARVSRQQGIYWRVDGCIYNNNHSYLIYTTYYDSINFITMMNDSYLLIS